jgi:23S rRNA pseudouridine1911/1915/1917 synthase
MPPASTPRPYHVAEAEAGQTLVSLLRQWQGEISWGDAKQLLKSRRVSVNGAMCLDEGRRVKAGDVVHIHPHARTPQPTADDVELLYWDHDVVVVLKPALMTTLRHHEERNWPAARKNLQPTLDECLPRILQTAESGEQPRPPARKSGKSRPGGRGPGGPRRPLPRVKAVHRLDRDTSGVMVFARNESAERRLIEQFKSHSIERVYRAIVHGHPADQTISRRLIRDRGDGHRGGTDSPTDGEDAVTHVRRIKNAGDYSLVECRLETGRTHQIRIHLSEAGHPLCGDPLYVRRREGTAATDDSGAPRLALHATKLAFEHPRTREWMDFEVEWPDDLERFWRRLSRDRREPV